MDVTVSSKTQRMKFQPDMWLYLKIKAFKEVLRIKYGHKGGVLIS